MLAAQALPEFNMVGDYPVTTPVRGPGDIYIRKLLRVFGEIQVEYVAAGYFGALRRCPRAYAAAFWPGLEVNVAFTRCYFFHHTFHAHLPLQLFPEKDQRARAGFQRSLPGLCTPCHHWNKNKNPSWSRPFSNTIRA